MRNKDKLTSVDENCLKCGSSEEEPGTISELQARNRIIGRYNGKYDVPDDIDFCNDEISEMFGGSLGDPVYRFICSNENTLQLPMTDDND